MEFIDCNFSNFYSHSNLWLLKQDLLQKNLTQIIIDELKNPIIKYGIITLILLSIVIGNTAYESPNISGAVLGLETLFGSLNFRIDNNVFNLYPIMLDLFQDLFMVGKFKIIERFLIILVTP